MGTFNGRQERARSRRRGRVDGRRTGPRDVLERLGEELHALLADEVRDALGALVDDDLRAGGERQDGVRRRLDGDDEVRVDVEGLVGVAEPVQDQRMLDPRLGVAPLARRLPALA